MLAGESRDSSMLIDITELVDTLGVDTKENLKSYCGY